MNEERRTDRLTNMSLLADCHGLKLYEEDEVHSGL